MRFDRRRWREVRARFDELVDLDAAERATRLNAMAAADPELHRAVAALLAADAEVGERLRRIDSRLLDPAPAARSPRAPSDPLGLVGHTLSHFRVLEPLGLGGMGVVYRAEDTRLGRTVALKFLLPEYGLQADAKARFLHEARSAGALDHPNICTVYDIEETEDGRLFLAMPLYAGERLEDRLVRKGALALRETMEIGRQIARGLHCAHGAGIVHRDLKPANLMLLPDGTLKILDFGLAKARDLGLTDPGQRPGTVAYMAPEQIKGETVDARADLWALGVILYQMLTGERPFVGDHPYAVAYSITHEEPVSPSVLRRDIPPAVSELVLWLLRKEPGKRCQSASDFLDALPTPGSALQPVQTLRHAAATRDWGRRRLGVSAMGVIAVGVLIALSRAAPGSRAAPCEGSMERTIAVLPFDNLSAQPEASAHLAGALHDEVITQLARIAALEVRGRRSTLGYSGLNQSPRQIGEELGVCRILRATVQRVGDRVRVNAQLVNTRTDEHDWAQSFDRDLTDVFAIQSELAHEIAAALQLQVTPAEREHLDRPPRRNAEAYDFYLRAREYQLRGDHPESQRSAELLYERAVELDPSFALAHARLAITRGWFWFFGYDRTAERIEQMRDAAETALRLDPALPEAHLAMGYYWYAGKGSYREALEEFETARRASPAEAEMHAAIAYVHRRQGRWQEATAGLERAVALEPRYPKVIKDLAVAYMQLRRYPEALRAWDRVIDLEPDNHDALLLRGELFLASHGTTDSLAAALRRIPPTWDPHGERTVAAARLALLRQRPTDVLVALEAIPPELADLRNYIRIATMLMLRAEAHHALQDTARARADYREARTTLEKAAADWISDPRIHSKLAVVHARLGQKEAALRQARLAREAAAADAVEGPRHLVQVAESYAWAGETGAAIDLLARSLRRPGFISAHHLRLDSRWEPLRRDPRFQRLLDTARATVMSGSISPTSHAQ